MKRLIFTLTVFTLALTLITCSESMASELTGRPLGDAVAAMPEPKLLNDIMGLWLDADVVQGVTVVNTRKLVVLGSSGIIGYDLDEVTFGCPLTNPKLVELAVEMGRFAKSELIRSLDESSAWAFAETTLELSVGMERWLFESTEIKGKFLIILFTVERIKPTETGDVEILIIRLTRTVLLPADTLASTKGAYDRVD